MEHDVGLELIRVSLPAHLRLPSEHGMSRCLRIAGHKWLNMYLKISPSPSSSPHTVTLDQK